MSDTAPVDANGDVVPCRYVHGEMIPLTKAEIEATKAWRDAPTSYAGSTARFKGSYTMSKGEKDKLFLQTGEHFDDHAHYRAWCKATGKRDIEKGEPADVHRRDLNEWAADTGGEGPLPEQFDWKALQRKNRKPIPMPWREQA